MKKITFFSAWLFVLLLSLFTLVKAPLLPYPITTIPKILNLVYRGLGIFTFSLLFLQIILGFFMDKLVKKFGNWIVKFHNWQGMVTYLLVLLHPISLLVFRYLANGTLDPYFAFINACFLCRTPEDYFLTFGRISFWLLTLSVFVSTFKKMTKEKLEKINLLNYIVFFAVAVHGYMLGMDFRSQPFFAFAIFAVAVVLGIFLFFELPRLYKDFKNW